MDKLDKLKVNTIKDFDINEASDYFDESDSDNWEKLEEFILTDGDLHTTVLENEFEFTDVTDDEWQAFDAGIQYASSRINAALKSAGVDLEIKKVDLVDAFGTILVRPNDTAESFVNRVFNKT